jgi:class 3 adenylate cyclase/tetratricopeptide (TPR) repeat protein
MECPRCRTENPSGQRFCSACGQKLVLACTDCGFENTLAARFCGGCGRQLDAKATISQPVAAPRQVPEISAEGERRPVTVLFADLVGFTELSARLDAEDLKAWAERFYERVDRVILDYGGSVDKHIGDAVMALFGAPVAHRDDGERAVRAALDIHAAMAAAGTGADGAGPASSVHVGIATGEVIAGGFARGYTVLGESVNLASRLVGLAGPGETVISDALRESLGPRVTAAALPPQPVKGIEGAVRAWRIEGLAQVRTHATPFVGRAHDRHQLSGMLAATRKSGHGRMVLLRGEAGIGKSRLLEETAADAMRRGFLLHQVYVLDFGAGRAQDAMPALVRSLLGVSPERDAAGRRAAVEMAAASGLIDAEERAPLEELLGLESAGERRLIYAAMDNATRLVRKQSLVAALARRLAAQRPVMIAIEDIHWTDGTLPGYLAALAEATARAPILLLVTTRPDGNPLGEPWRAGLVHAEISTLDLAPLHASDAAALAATLMSPGDARVAACLSRAQGNPLFLEQLLRHTADVAAESVPVSVQSVVLGRLDRLPAEEKTLLQAASVLGQRFHAETLAHLLDRPDVEVKGLIEAYLLKPDAEGLVFAHALIRDGVYGSLLKTRRKALHRRAADWFHGRDGGLEAEHLERAEDPTAAAAYLEAATTELERFQFDRASALAARGLTLATGDGIKGPLAATLGEARQSLGDTQGALEAFEQAGISLPPGPERLQALLGVAGALSVLDRFDEALSRLAQAQVDAERLALPVLLARIHFLRGNILFPRGEVGRCLAEHTRALARAVEAKAPEEEARAHGGLGDGYYMSGDFQRSAAHFERCVELSARQGFRRIEVANRPMCVLARLFALDFAGSLAEADLAVRQAIETGQRRAEMVAEHMRFWVRFETGDLAGAQEASERALAISRQLSARRFEAEGLMFLGQIRHARGDPQGLEWIREAAAIGRETPSYFLPSILSLLAMLTPHGQEREEAIAEGDALMKSDVVWHNHVFFNRYAIETMLRCNDPARAEHYAAALERATANPLPYVDYLVRRGRALADHRRGKGDPFLLAGLRDEAIRHRWKEVLPLLREALDAKRN